MVQRTIIEFKKNWEMYMGMQQLTEQEEIEKLNALPVRWWMKHHLYLGTKRWMRLRVYVLKRDGGRCVNCGSEKAAQVDHIKYAKRWGDETPLDLQTLCWMCHNSKTRKFDLMASGKFYALWAKQKVVVGDRQLFKVVRA